MTDLDPKTSIKDSAGGTELSRSVLTEIESGKVKMRPKWKFVIQTILLIVGSILAALIAIFIASFIVFMLRETGLWFTPGFGLKGLTVFLTSLPWILLLVTIIFIYLLEVLIKQYSFSYIRPLTYSILGVIIVVSFFSIAIGLTSFHENLFEWAEHDHIPFGRRMTEPPGNVTLGQIIEIKNPGFKIRDFRDQIFIVTITPQTQLPPGSNLQAGDSIVILGDRQGNTIMAVAIQKPSNFPPRRPPTQEDGELELH